MEREIKFGNVKGSRSEVNEDKHARKGVAILLSEMLKCVKGSEEVSSTLNP